MRRIVALLLTAATFKTLLLATATSFSPAWLNPAQLLQIVQELEGRLSTLATEVEALYARRCSESMYSNCNHTIYDNCRTALPSPTCTTALRGPECGTSCGYVQDFTVSNVWSPVPLHEMNDALKQDACVTRHLDSLFSDNLQSFQASRLYSGTTLPNQYIGTAQGLFRMLPAQHTTGCTDYDPRVRPWYRAASTVPKTVVILMDFSGSMVSRAPLAAAAASELLSRLTYFDYFAVLAFGLPGTSTIYPPAGGLAQASQQVVANVLGILSSVERDVLVRNAEGGEQLTDGDALANAFAAAFDLFDANGANTSACMKTVVMLTDSTAGFLTAGSAIPQIARETRARNATVFTVSVGAAPGDDGGVPKVLACETEGVWIPLRDEPSVAEVVSSIFAYYTLGLGHEPTGSWVVWTEPYIWAGTSVLGTTVATPVFDRINGGQPRLLGVVALDSTILALEEAAGSPGHPEARTAVLELLASRSLALCPTSFGVSECDRQAVRQIVAGSSATCLGECTELLAMQQAACLPSSSYPRGDRLAPNNDLSGRSATERLCCAGNLDVGTPFSHTSREGAQCQSIVRTETALTSPSGKYLLRSRSDQWRSHREAEESCGAINARLLYLRNPNVVQTVVTEGVASVNATELAEAVALMRSAGIYNAWIAERGPEGCLMLSRRPGLASQTWTVVVLANPCDDRQPILCNVEEAAPPPSPPPPLPTPPPTPPLYPPGENPCFPSSAVVFRANGTRARVDALRTGDAIRALTLAGELTTDTVSLLSIARPEATAVFVHLSLEGGVAIQLTAAHHVPVGGRCCARLKMAADVAVGDTLWAVEGDTAVPRKAIGSHLVDGTGLHSRTRLGIIPRYRRHRDRL